MVDSSKAMVLLLFIPVFNVPPIVCGVSVFDPCFVVRYLVSSLFFHHLHAYTSTTTAFFGSIRQSWLLYFD